MRLVVLLFVAFCLLGIADAAPTTVIVSLDGFRYDYINKAETPVLDSLSRVGVSALSLQPVFPTKTFPSHISMATGLNPESHGIIDNKFKNLVTGENYTVFDNSSKMVAKWYRGEFIWETLARYGFGSAAFLWPGSESYTPWKRPTYSINWSDSLCNQDRFDKFNFWLNEMHEERVPELFMLYFDDTDQIGHKFGTNSEEIKSAISRLDSAVGKICQIIAKSDNRADINLIVLSDHGMANIYPEKAIDISKFAADDILIQNSGAYCRFSFSDKDKIKDIYSKLKDLKHCRVFLKNEIPAHLNFKQDPNIGDILLMAEPGHFFMHDKNNYAENVEGAHGYDPYYTDMHGIFIASGKQFKSGVKTGTLYGIDLYALICKMYGLEDYINTQSQLNRISFILQ